MTGATGRDFRQVEGDLDELAAIEKRVAEHEKRYPWRYAPDAKDFLAKDRKALVARVREAEAVIAEVTEAWWSGTELGDDGVHYSDDIEHAMDVIWAALARYEKGETQ